MEEHVPRITLRDVARLAGVDPSTVSRALDPKKSWVIHAETREKIVQAARELGYLPDEIASGLRRGRSGTIGIIVPDLANPFIAPMIRGIENGLEGRGLMALIAETQEDRGRTSRVLDHLVGRRVDGVITAAARKGDEALLKKVAKIFPLVLASRNLDGSGLPAIMHDDELGGRLLAEHLITLGHTVVAQIEGPQDISSFVDRGRGFRTAFNAAGGRVIGLDEEAINATISEGKRLTRRFLNEVSPLPTAIFAPNDLMALGVLDALEDAHLRCPEDISLVGYNDSPQAPYTSPRLTTVRLPGYELGRLAAELVVTLYDEPTISTPNVSLPPVLVVRQSTAPPRRVQE